MRTVLMWIVAILGGLLIAALTFGLFMMFTLIRPDSILLRNIVICIAGAVALGAGINSAKGTLEVRGVIKPRDKKECEQPNPSD